MTMTMTEDDDDEDNKNEDAGDDDDGDGDGDGEPGDHNDVKSVHSGIMGQNSSKIALTKSAHSIRSWPSFS